MFIYNDNLNNDLHLFILGQGNEIIKWLRENNKELQRFIEQSRLKQNAGESKHLLERDDEAQFAKSYSISAEHMARVSEGVGSGELSAEAGFGENPEDES